MIFQKQSKYYYLTLSVFFSAILAVVILTLLPGEKAPHVSLSDKWQHFIAYFSLSFLGTLLCENRKDIFLLIFSLVLLGGILEILQGSLDINRYAEWFDFLANSLGVLSGMLIFISFSFIFNKLKFKNSDCGL